MFSWEGQTGKPRPRVGCTVACWAYLFLTGILSYATQHLPNSVWSALVPQELCGGEDTDKAKDLDPCQVPVHA